jgi:hypothetical protein
MKTKLIVLKSIVLFVIGCSPMLYVPKCDDTAQQTKLMEGRTLYVKHCNGCHNLYLPNHFTESMWKKNLEEMQPKAKITDEEKKLILNFLLYSH